MRLRSSGFLKWSSLPPEIRHMILNTIVDLKNPRWADLASVSKEWQSVIGVRNMATLKLQSPSCFDGFEKIVQQRHLVKHIYLCVELPKYDCTLCKARTRTPSFSRDSSIISHAIGKILSILSTWKTQGPLTLELNAVSCKSTWHDPSHGWANGTQLCTCHCGHQPVDSSPIPPLSSTFQSGQTVVAAEREEAVGMVLPKTLKSLILFQHSVEHLTQSAYQDPSYERLRDIRNRLDIQNKSSRYLAQTSLRLEQFFVSFLINAGDFLAACRKEWTWEHLQSLALSFQGSGKHHQEGINSPLLSTAKVALRMPKLETLVLWSGDRGTTCAFIYTRNEYCAQVVWRGTWDLDISQEALKAWEAVAALYSLELRVEHERIQEVIRSCGDAIHHLNLPCQIIQPTSLWQMRVEEA
ncbi:hypothetical protein FG05_02128 [Fusarium graminearum]|nr:hypothetical protein FG05_02128 [Fusarium graminearum]